MWGGGGGGEGGSSLRQIVKPLGNKYVKKFSFYFIRVSTIVLRIHTSVTSSGKFQMTLF